MSRFILVVLLLSGCSSEIRCWYSVARIQNIGQPWFELKGRTPVPMTDLDGPYFPSADEMQKYVAANHLHLCAESQP